MQANQCGKNGIYGMASFVSDSTLDLSDAAAVRALYGSRSDESDCCGKITGKIEVKSYKSTQKSMIWAEEFANGRVAAQTNLLDDGSFSLAGLTAGKYRLFCQTNGAENRSAVEIGNAEIIKNKSVFISKTIEADGESANLEFVGFNGRLAKISIPVNAGKSFTIYLGGKNIDPANVKIGFNSPALKVVRDSIVTQDFGADLSAVSLTISVGKNALPGSYSLYVEQNGSRREYLVGAIKVGDNFNPWNSDVLPEN